MSSDDIYRNPEHHDTGQPSAGDEGRGVPAVAPDPADAGPSVAATEPAGEAAHRDTVPIPVDSGPRDTAHLPGGEPGQPAPSVQPAAAQPEGGTPGPVSPAQLADAVRDGTPPPAAATEGPQDTRADTEGPADVPAAFAQPAHPGYPYAQPNAPYGAPSTATFPAGPPGPPASYPPAGYGHHAQGPAHRGRGGRLVAGGVLALVIALGAGTVGGLVGYGLHGNTGTSVINSTTGRANTVSNVKSLADVAQQVEDSVVVIKTGNAEGSGVVLTDSGYILTNNHVVAEANGGTINVTFSNGKTARATIVGTDAGSDLAVLKVDNVSGLKPATFGDSDAIKVGDEVLAIGSPLGLDGSVTAGIISAKNRTITEGSQQNQLSQQSAGATLSGLLQTDAAINPGNSGGALVDTAGHVVGINTAIATSGSGSNGNIGVGFAIPSNKAKTVAAQLMKGGKVSHPYLGVRVSDGTDNPGALIAQVESGSPAAKAGMKQGDLITAANGKPISSGDDLVAAVQAAQPGDKLTLTVQRTGGQQTITVTVGSK